MIQAKRDYLVEAASHEHTDYHGIDSSKDTFIPEGGYWHDFFSNPRPWHEQPQSWKYVCTYTLSMKTADFKGGLRKIITITVLKIPTWGIAWSMPARNST